MFFICFQQRASQAYFCPKYSNPFYQFNTLSLCGCYLSLGTALLVLAMLDSIQKCRLSMQVVYNIVMESNFYIAFSEHQSAKRCVGDAPWRKS